MFSNVCWRLNVFACPNFKLVILFLLSDLKRWFNLFIFYLPYLTLWELTWTRFTYIGSLSYSQLCVFLLMSVSQLSHLTLSLWELNLGEIQISALSLAPSFVLSPMSAWVCNYVFSLSSLGSESVFVCPNFFVASWRLLSPAASLIHLLFQSGVFLLVQDLQGWDMTVFANRSCVLFLMSSVSIFHLSFFYIISA